MKSQYGNHLGICISSNDPENRGRVQIFVPHIMPALYEGWNELGEDITLECVGDNLPNGLSSKVVEKLQQILPWAEAAMPIVGNSVAGSYNSETGNFNQTNTPESAAGNSDSGAPFAPDVFGGSFTAELNDPNIRNKLFNLMEAEVGGQGPDSQLAFMETVRNRAAVRGVAINTIISDQRYYEPYQTGAINRAAARLTDTKRTSYSGIISTALNGSNTTNGATHNASAGVAASVRRGGFNSVPGSIVEVGGETFYSKTGEQKKLASLLARTQKVQLNDPATSPDASAAGAAAVPFSRPEPYHTQSTPTQDAITATTVNTPTPININGLGERARNESFNSGRFGDGNVNFCGKIARGFDYNIFKDSYFTKSFGEKTGSPSANKSTKYWTDSGYYKVAETVPSQLPFGTKIIYQKGLGTQGKIHGHVATIGDGKILGSGIGENFKRYEAQPGQKITVLLPTNKASDRFDELYKTDLPSYNFSDIENSGKLNQQTVEDGTPDQTTSFVKNTTETTAVPLDTTGMAQGMFAIPGPGAMLWVFFREGNPMFPVYFAASYGAAEWQSAYKASSPAAYGPQENNSNNISNQSIFRPNNAGAITFTGAVGTEKDSRAVRMAHANGGYLELHPYGSVHYSPNEHLEQVAGTNYSYCLNREVWTQGDSNSVVLGNQWMVIGNPSQSNIETIEKLTEKVKQINAEMMKN